MPNPSARFSARNLDARDDILAVTGQTAQTAEEKSVKNTSKFCLGVVALVFSALLASPTLAQSDNGEAAAFSPQSGWWTGTDTQITMESNVNGRVFGAILTFENSDPVWYVFKTTPLMGAQTALLQRFVGGQTLTGKYRENTFQDFAGGANLAFGSPSSGVLSMQESSVDIGRLDIIPNGAASGPASGAPGGGWWYNASESGTGYFLEAQGDTMLFTALLYNDLGQPTWYMARNSMVNPSFFSGKLTLAQAGG